MLHTQKAALFAFSISSHSMLLFPVHYSSIPFHSIPLTPTHPLFDINSNRVLCCEQKAAAIPSCIVNWGKSVCGLTPQTRNIHGPQPALTAPSLYHLSCGVLCPGGGRCADGPVPSTPEHTFLRRPRHTDLFVCCGSKKSSVPLFV